MSKSKHGCREIFVSHSGLSICCGQRSSVKPEKAKRKRDFAAQITLPTSEFPNVATRTAINQFFFPSLTLSGELFFPRPTGPSRRSRDVSKVRAGDGRRRAGRDDRRTQHFRLRTRITLPGPNIGPAVPARSGLVKLFVFPIVLAGQKSGSSAAGQRLSLG